MKYRLALLVAANVALVCGVLFDNTDVLLGAGVAYIGILCETLLKFR